jgi:hypothetical protein
MILRTHQIPGIFSRKIFSLKNIFRHRDRPDFSYMSNTEKCFLRNENDFPYMSNTENFLLENVFH